MSITGILRLICVQPASPAAAVTDIADMKERRERDFSIFKPVFSERF
jgi:hypothetical protein